MIEVAITGVDIKVYGHHLRMSELVLIVLWRLEDSPSLSIVLLIFYSRFLKAILFQYITRRALGLWHYTPPLFEICIQSFLAMAVQL
jgi:hypothetical protein